MRIEYREGHTLISQDAVDELDNRATKEDHFITSYHSINRLLGL